MFKIGIIGGGNWGTAMARNIAINVVGNSNIVQPVYMWAMEEQFEGNSLIAIINKRKENVKYLPGIKLPENLFITPNLQKCIDECNVLLFVIPHQFIEMTLQKIKFNKDRQVICISLIKGFLMKEGELILISNLIKQKFDNCGVLMGANIANEVAKDCISEGTLSCNEEYRATLTEIISSKTYIVSFCEDKDAVEVYGALKNIVSIGFGMCSGPEFGYNTRVALMRRGLLEMILFTQTFFKAKPETILESAGVADLMVSCLIGRNSNCGKNIMNNISHKEFEESLGGQKIQGVTTSKEVFDFLDLNSKTSMFPFFVKIYKICYEDLPCKSILDLLK